MKNIIIASTSTIYGSEYLEYILSDLKIFFNSIDEILFIPYARPSGITYEEYTSLVREIFKKINKKIVGIHEKDDPISAVKKAKAIFTGGGNTFVLVDTLNRENLFPVIKRVVENGTLYFGTSAGSNIAGQNMKTTNDMPIVYPENFDTIGLIPFNINAHFLDPDINSKHKGETRETRIKEFHVFNDISVIGLREGSWLEVIDQQITLKGNLNAKIFRKNKEPYEVEPGLLIIKENKR